MCAAIVTGATFGLDREISMQMMTWKNVKAVRPHAELVEKRQYPLTKTTGGSSSGTTTSLSKSGTFYDAARNGYR